MVCRNCYAEVALTTRLVELLETFYNESNLSNKTFYNESNLSKTPNVLCSTCSMWQEKSSKNMIDRRPNSYKWDIPAKNTSLSLCFVVLCLHKLFDLGQGSEQTFQSNIT